jgi:hypothetical protein
VPNHIGRIYVIAGALVVLFLGWAAIAAHPWDATPVDPRVAALNERRVEVRQDAAKAKKIVTVRWKRYEHRLAVRRRAVNAAWRQRRREEATYQTKLALARANRQVIVRTVYVQVGPSTGGSAPAYSPPGGSGGGYVAPAPSGSGSAPVASAPVASAPVASAPVSAPPVVSVGGSAPVTASGSS